MTRIKHVLVLLILVLPMFALAPTLVASPTEALTSPIEADTSLPAASIEETLRVAVYVENDVSLPAYAEGGVYTNHSGNVISFLQGEGYAVTPMTGQDILDYKLLAAKYDAFVLPNQLPKDNVTDLVKDYWLAGGGILSIGGSIGYLLYMGMIHPSLQGDFGLVGFGSSPFYWYDQPIADIEINERHTIAQFYEDHDVIVVNDTVAVFDFNALSAMIDDGFTTVSTQYGPSENGAIFSLDSDYQGGKIVQIPGNCSTIPVWERPIITDAIDWLAPKPKARVAFDITHDPYYGVDTWDTEGTHRPRFNIWRDFLVNHSFTVDKLYPTGSNLTYADLAPFDVLIIDAPALNYSLIEFSLIRTWVGEGNGLFYLGDYGSLNGIGQSRFNELMEPWDIFVDYDGTNVGSFSTSDFENHPTLEDVGSIEISGGEWLNISGSAYPLVNNSADIIIAATEPGLGRVVVAGDINWIDYTHYMNGDNLQFGINLIDWLGSANADILIFTDEPNDHRLRQSVAYAANELDLKYMITGDQSNLVYYLDEYDFDLLIVDSPWNSWAAGMIDEITEHVEGGGKFIASYYYAHNDPTNALWPLLGFEPLSAVPGGSDMYIWTSGHPIFNLPNDYAADRFEPTYDYGTEGSLLHVYANATSLGGMTASAEENQSTIVLANDGRTLFTGYLIDQFQGDFDNSTYVDNIELWMNELGFMYYDRPMINHPDDVTYMETETGNEISWTPAADAGPWEYVVRENGSIIESGHWSGGSITINVDGVNASITDYQLTVFDRLGYSASDLVILNVTEYVATTTGTGAPLDPMLLIIIGVGAVIVIVIIIIVMKKKK